MANVEFHVIGVGDKNLASASETRHQIDDVKELECQLQVEGEALTWDFFDNPEEPRSLFQTILNDRDLRVDRGISLENRPPFCVVTSMDGKAVRLEFYEGKIILRLRYDIRTSELDGAKLPNYLKAHRELLQAEQRFFTPLGAM
jgi:hypothetical protein